MGLNAVCVNSFACVQGLTSSDTPPAEELARAQRAVSRLVAELEPVISDDGGRRRGVGLRSTGGARRVSWKESAEGDTEEGLESDDVEDSGDDDFKGEIRCRRTSGRAELSEDEKAAAGGVSALKGDDSHGGGGGAMKAMRRPARDFWLEPKLKNANFTRNGMNVPIIAKREKKFVEAFGLAKYKDLIEKAPTGKLDEVMLADKPVWKCMGTQGRYTCAALYTQDEYEELAIEAHVYCRRSELRNFPDRYPFFCKWCDQDFKDKNGVNFHRIRDLCPVYAGPEPLKMYPVWAPSQNDELNRLCNLKGVKLPPSKPTKAGKAEKREGDAAQERSKKVRRVLPHTSAKCPELISTAPPGKDEAGSSACTKVGEKGLEEVGHGSAEVRRHQPACGGGPPSRSRRPASTADGEGSVQDGVKVPGGTVARKRRPSPPRGRRVSSRGFADGKGRLEDPITIGDGDPVAVQPAAPQPRELGGWENRMLKRSSASLRAAGSDVGSGTNPPQPQPLPSHPNYDRLFRVSRTAREAIEAEAEVVAASWTLGDVGLAGEPPEPSPVSGLFYLINEGRAQHLVDRKYLEDPDACLDRVLEGHRSGRFRTAVDLAFCDWWVRPGPQGVEFVKRTKEVKEMCKYMVKLWSPEGYEDMEDARLDEIRKFGLYLEYLLAKRTYEDSIRRNEEALQTKRRQYVEGKLKDFDVQEDLKAEEAAWGWSSLYQVLRRAPPHTGPQPPWKHTAEEWVLIKTALLAGEVLQPATLELDCPHIVRAFKMFYRNREGRLNPLSHPVVGITRAMVLHIAEDDELSRHLTRCVQDLVRCGWIWFPNMESAVDSLQHCGRDMLCLLGFHEFGLQEFVLQKVECFINNVAHRAILDMVRFDQHAVLASLWYTPPSAKEDQIKADQVFSTTMLHREDVDIGCILGPFEIGVPSTPAMVECSKAAQTQLKQLRELQLQGMYQTLGLLEPVLSNKKGLPDENLKDSYDPLENIPAQVCMSPSHRSRVEGIDSSADEDVRPPVVTFATPEQGQVVDSVSNVPLQSTPKAGFCLRSFPLPSQLFALQNVDLTEDFTSGCAGSEMVLLAMHERNPTPAVRRPQSLGFRRTPQGLTLGLAPSGDMQVCQGRMFDLNNTDSKCGDPAPLCSPALGVPVEQISDDSPQNRHSPNREMTEVRPQIEDRPKEMSLEDDMLGFMRQKGAHTARSMDLLLGLESCRLSIDSDVALLLAPAGMLSTDLMHWWQIWYSSQVSNNITISNPYLCTLLRTWANDQGETPESIEAFLKLKMNPLTRSEVLIVPIFWARHWSVTVLTEHCFLHFDSCMEKELHKCKKTLRLLGKVWAIHSGHGKGSDGWSRACENASWSHVKCPQQSEGWECGWYSIKCIMEFCENPGEEKRWSGEMQSMFTWEEALDVRRLLAEGICELIQEMAEDHSKWTAVPQELCSRDGSTVEDIPSARTAVAQRRVRIGLKSLLEDVLDEDDGSIGFLVGNKTARLKISDVEALENPAGGFLSADLMDWFVVWQLNLDSALQGKNVSCCSPYLPLNLKTHIAEYGESVESIERFYWNHSGLSHDSGTELLIPFLADEHWSLMVLTNSGLLQIDSMCDGELHGSFVMHRALAKLWAIHAGFRKGSAAWKRAREPCAWTLGRFPQQRSDWECGWYTMKYITEFLKKAGRNVDWTAPMEDLFDEDDALEMRGIVSNAVAEVISKRDEENAAWAIVRLG